MPHHHRHLHLGVLQNHLFDLVQVHALSTDLHLVVQSTDECQSAVLVLERVVTGPVEREGHVLWVSWLVVSFITQPVRKFLSVQLQFCVAIVDYHRFGRKFDLFAVDSIAAVSVGAEMFEDFVGAVWVCHQRIGDEPGSVSVGGVADVSTRHTGAANVDLAHHLRRHGLHEVVQQIHVHSSDGRADGQLLVRQVLVVVPPELVDGGTYRRFRGAVGVEELDVRVVLGPLEGGVGHAGLARRDDLAQRRHLARAVDVEDGGRQGDHAHLQIPQRFHELLTQPLVLLQHGKRPAAKQRCHDL